MAKKTRYTVIGAGNGGKVMAAHLALMGFPVTLYNRTLEHIAAIEVRGGIDLAGARFKQAPSADTYGSPRAVRFLVRRGPFGAPGGRPGRPDGRGAPAISLRGEFRGAPFAGAGQRAAIGRARRFSFVRTAHVCPVRFAVGPGDQGKTAQWQVTTDVFGLSEKRFSKGDAGGRQVSTIHQTR